jgi:multiple sugar transport system substrate-binding protein
VRRPRHATVSVSALAALALLAACTAGTEKKANEDTSKPVTLTVWHGWTDDREVNAFQKSLDAYHAAHPNVTIKAVKAIDDDKITQGIRSGSGPDVAISFTTDNVGQFCSSGAWQDLNPYLDKSKVDRGKTFPKAVLDYTSFQGKQCALPILADAYGLYYNKAMFQAKGVTAPPKTLSELVEDAKKLTVTNPDGSIKVAGFVPNWHMYEMTQSHTAPSFGATWQKDGKSNLAADPAWSELLNWQKSAVEQLGGLAKLEKFRAGLGEEFSADNPFEKGKVAMAIDGEWRTAFLKDEAPTLQYGTAPFPVADSKQDLYGGGYLSGTIIGIAKTSKSPAAAWDLVKYLTTDTKSLVDFSNAIHNVPSTFDALKSPDLDKDANFRTFFDIAQNEHSSTTPASPNGGKYQTDFQSFGYDYEAGKAKDLAAGLAKLDKQIDAEIALAKP